MTDEYSPNRILVVLLGASEWPKAPEFEASHAFANSALAIKDYFVDPKRFGLPSDNFLDLFDSDASYDEIDEQIGDWIDERVSSPKGTVFSDLIIIFVGHAGFEHGHDEYLLAIRRTRESNLGASSIPISALARTIKERARQMRRYVILDCCYAASAFKHFQSSNIAEVATRQTLEAFAATGKGYGVPSRGTALLCSSRHNKPSLLSPSNELTMFSEALLYALNHGNPQYQDLLPLESVCLLSKEYLHSKYDEAAPRPEVHCPDQVEGAVAAVPLFPNLGKTSGSPAAVNTQESASPSAHKQKTPAHSKPNKAAETNTIEELQLKVRQDKSDASLHAQLGDALLEEKRWSDAAKSFTNAIELNRQVASWHYKLAIAIVESSGSAETAEREFAEAVRLEPENQRFRLDFAHFLSSRRKWGLAVPQLEFALAKEPTNVEAQAQLALAKQQNKLAEEAYLKGLECEKSGHLDQALEMYRNVHNLEINFADVNSRIASLLGQDERRKNIERLNQSLASTPDDPSLHIRLGRLYLEGGYFDSAEAALKRAIELDAAKAEYHALLGRVYHSQEDWDAAEKQFERALALDPENPERYIDLGATAFAQLKWNRALELYESAKSYSFDPKSRIRLRQLMVDVNERLRQQNRRETNRKIQVHVSQGRQLVAEERWLEAEAAFEKARAIDPTNPQRYLDLGATAFAQMNWSKALQFYKKGKRLTSDPVSRVRLDTAISKAKEYRNSQNQPKSKRIRKIIIAAAVLLIVVVVLAAIYLKH